jgi:hypothetical protein
MITVIVIVGVVLLLAGLYVVTHQWRGPVPLPSVMKTDADFPKNPNEIPVTSSSTGTGASTTVEEVVPTVPYTYHVFMQNGGVGLTPQEIVKVFDLVAMAQAKNVAETNSSYRRALPLSSYIYQLVPSRTATVSWWLRCVPCRYGTLKTGDGRCKLWRYMMAAHSILTPP